ncbi:hypothetical protein HRG_014173 [Hirsutella rhossiliensis]
MNLTKTMAALLSVVIGLFATVATTYSMGDGEESLSITPRESPLGILPPQADTGQNINFDVVAHLCCPPGVLCGTEDGVKQMVGKLNEKFAQFQISFDLKKFHQFSDPRLREGGQSTLNYLFLLTNSDTFDIKGFTLDPPQDFTKQAHPEHDGPHCAMVLLTREGTFSEIDKIIMVHDTQKPVLVRTTKYVYVFSSAKILDFESSRKAEVRQVALMRKAADGAGAPTGGDKGNRTGGSPKSDSNNTPPSPPPPRPLRPGCKPKLPGPPYPWSSGIPNQLLGTGIPNPPGGPESPSSPNSPPSISSISQGRSSLRTWGERYRRAELTYLLPKDADDEFAVTATYYVNGVVRCTGSMDD